MIRDFSDENYNNLIEIVKQVESEKWSDFTDWFGDRWYDLMTLTGVLNIQNSLDNISDYQKKVIDKNNASEEMIKKIFDDVKSVNTNYTTRFAAYEVRLDNFLKLVKNVDSCIDPSTGNYSVEKIHSLLTNGFVEYKNQDKLLMKVCGDGIDAEILSRTDSATVNTLLNTLTPAITAALPNLKIGDKVEIPLGPGVIAYYSVSGSFNKDSPIEADIEIENQKAELNYGISASAGSATATFGTDGLDSEYSYTEGNTKYSISYHISTEEYDVSRSVESQT